MLVKIWTSKRWPSGLYFDTEERVAFTVGWCAGVAIAYLVWVGLFVGLGM